MSKDLDWLVRVSQESSETASIKPEGVDLNADSEAANIVGGDEKLTNEGKSSANHEVDLKDATVPDDNADAADADKAIGVKVSAEDNGDAPAMRIDLQTGKPSVEDEQTDEEKEAAEAEAAAAAGDAGAEPAAAEVPGEPGEGGEATDPIVEVPVEGAPGEDAPGDGGDAVAPTEPVEGVEPAAGEPPVDGEPPVEGAEGTEPAAAEGTDALPAEAGEPALPEGTDGVEPPLAELEGGDAAVDPTADSGKVMIAVDPVTEIKEGPEAAAEAAVAEGAAETPLTNEELPEGTEAVSQEGFVGGLVGFLAGGMGWVPFVGAGVHAAVKAKRLKMQQDIEAVAKRIEKIRKGDLEDAKKNGMTIPKSELGTDWVQIVKGALLGQFFGSLYGARQGSDIENLNKQLREKLKELEKEIEAAGISNEDFELSDEPDTEVDLDSAADDEFASEFDTVGEDVSSLGDMGAALEEYNSILRDEAAAGRTISPGLARAIKIGLEHFDEPFLLEGAPSLEDFADPIGKFTVSNEFANGLGEKAKAVGGAIIEAIKKLIAKLADIAAEMMNNVGKLQEANDALTQQVNALQSSAKGQINVQSATRLFVGGEFAGDNAQNYQRMHQFCDKFMVDYPKFNRGLALAIMKVIDEVHSNGMRKLPPEEIASVFETQFLPGMFGVVAVGKDEIKEMSGYDSLFASPKLLGNRRMVVGKSEMAGKDGISALSSCWKVSLVAGEVGANPSISVALPDQQELRKILKELESLIKAIPNYAGAAKKMANDQAMLKVYTHPWFSGELQHAASGLVASMTTPTGHLVGYVANTIKVAQAFVASCVAQHQGGASA
ncbi:phiKZ-like phage internal head protein [compost metagenome]